MVTDVLAAVAVPLWATTTLVSTLSGLLFAANLTVAIRADNTYSRVAIKRAHWISRISIVFAGIVIAHPLFLGERLIYPLGLIGPGLLIALQLLILPALNLAQLESGRSKWKSPRYQEVLRPEDEILEDRIESSHKNLVKRFIASGMSPGDLKGIELRVWRRTPPWRKRSLKREIESTREAAFGEAKRDARKLAKAQPTKAQGNQAYLEALEKAERRIWGKQGRPPQHKDR